MMPRLLLAGTMVVATTLAGPLLAISQSVPRAGDTVIVLTLPWSESAVSLIDRAGGRTIGPERTAIAALAISEAPDFVENLKLAGAWIVLDGRGLSAFCGG